MHSKSIILALGLLSAELVAGHATVVGVTGDAGGVTGMGLGVSPNVNRKSQIPTQPSSSPNNPEADTTVFGHGDAAAAGCGKTALGGAMKDTASIMQAVSNMMSMAGGLPQVNSGGTLTVTMHQVNADGAPTYKADIDTTGTGNGFTPINVISGGQGAPGILGDQGLSFNIGQLPANNTVQIQMPTGGCTGAAPDGSSNSMLMNNAAAGGFGSCMAVSMAGGSSTGTATNTSNRRHARDTIKAREVFLNWVE
ncbi:hypothetical protein NA57DRAFT_77211 [Rhizodiscina lignyota]|uniref:Uncharacterized protein n=1 Tax=Rhizodiscina lignyota TaxID=1504668 RepID=A0A9P4IFY1_9PEZI|nr:hypothetical protein NA57DRAFT_77211 [Rhizodiscina lignyota]